MHVCVSITMCQCSQHHHLSQATTEWAQRWKVEQVTKASRDGSFFFLILHSRVVSLTTRVVCYIACTQAKKAHCATRYDVVQILVFAPHRTSAPIFSLGCELSHFEIFISYTVVPLFFL